MIYDMVVADAPDTLNMDHPVGESTLRQPALAKVNRQLCSEVLPIWYKERFFGICVYPKRHSEADQVWQDFVDRFKAHTDGADGSHYLSRIKRIQLELWHPALDPGFLPDPDTIPGLIHTETSHRTYLQTGLLSYDMCNGVYIRLGDVNWPGSKWSLAGHRVGDKDTNWADRTAVRALLEAGIVEERGDRYPDRLERFWRTFPFDRLVDLVMLVGEECKEAACSVHIKTSFAPLSVTFRPESPPPEIDDDWAGAIAPDDA